MEPSTPERPFRTLWIGVGLLVVILALSVVMRRVQPPAGSDGDSLPIIGRISDFTLTNQLGDVVTLADLRGHVWVADIIFTRCAGPCPRMTRQMAALQAALPESSGVRLISLTTDPDHDSAEVLARYAERYGADARRWQFLTGTKPQIASLAIDSLKLTALDKPEATRTDASDLFIHSTIFVLVDREARLRGVFETTGEEIEWEAVQGEILQAIEQLESEP